MQSFLDAIIKKIFTSKDLDISKKFFIGLIVIGCLIKLLISNFNNPNSEGSIGDATGTIWGYSLVLFAILGIVILKIDNTKPNFNNQVLDLPWYLFVLSGMILWIIYLNAEYFKEINKNHIPPQYYMWNNWSTLFILIISFLMLINLNNETLTEPSDNDRIMNLLIGFVLFINFIITGIQQTILQNFSVDG